MIYALAALILTAALCLLPALIPKWANLARPVAVTGTAVALFVALQQQGLQGGGVKGTPVAWPDFMGPLGTTFYRSDTLAAGLGAWCILLGGICLLRMGVGWSAAIRPALGTLAIATLYSLSYTADLRAFASHVLLLVFLTWGLLSEEGPAGLSPKGALVTRRRLAQIVGALTLLGAVALIGRTTGGVYDLAEMSLSALTFWPLLMIVLFTVFWMGLAPLTGWGAICQRRDNETGAEAALVQGIVVGVPAVLLLIRLQALISSNALAGSLPVDWLWFTLALSWLGGITAVSAGAGAIIWAGTTRWSAMLTAYNMGLAVWAVGLDTSSGRYAALAILGAYGLGRVTLEMSGGQLAWLSRLASGLSLVGAPLTVGFASIWLLGAGVVEARHAVLALVIAMSAIFAACGAALHLATDDNRWATDRRNGYLGWVALILSVVLVATGALPDLWLPQVEAMVGITGGGSRLGVDWAGVQSQDMFVPLALMSAGAIVVGGLAALFRLWAKSSVTRSSYLLPTALSRLQKTPPTNSNIGPLLSNPPPAVWWLSLTWLDRGLYGSGALLTRLATRFGLLLARLEGRYYLPLALVLTLLILLAITR